MKTTLQISKTNFDDHTFTKGRLRACPRSWDHANLETTFKIHYASGRELQKNGGICAACRKKIERENNGVASGKRSETPAEFERHHRPDLENDHAGSSGPGDLEPAVWFDFDAIDNALGDLQPTARQEAAQALKKIFMWCFPAGKRSNLLRAAQRLAVLVVGVCPDVLEGESMTDVAQRLGLTKSALSSTSVNLQDRLGFKFANARSAEARQRMAQRQLGHPAHNVKKPSGHARRKDS